VSAPPSTAPTYGACLTPAGAAAIATVALQGPEAWTLACALFRPRSNAAWPPSPPTAGRFWLGRLAEQPGGPAVDEVVLSLRRLTPEPRVEIHCHGGREVVRWLLELFASRGVQVCSWQEFGRQTIPGPVRSAAEATLAEAPTVRTAGILLDQVNGAFCQALAAVRAALETHNLIEADRLLAQLLRFADVGRHLITPWRVAVLGAPNVGKSSLVNALAGYQRSVVAATPGTTRDVVTTAIAAEGWPIELSDTAGLRDAALDLEGQGIDRARQAARTADLCLWVLDSNAAPVWPGAEIPNVRPVLNKTDLPAAWDVGQAQGAIRVSARTGDGIVDLCAALAGWLVPDPPPAGAAVPFTPELTIMIDDARKRCALGQLEAARRILALLEPRPEKVEAP
jgi:tRNA modification GTPase